MPINSGETEATYISQMFKHMLHSLVHVEGGLHVNLGGSFFPEEEEVQGADIMIFLPGHYQMNCVLVETRNGITIISGIHTETVN